MIKVYTWCRMAVLRVAYRVVIADMISRRSEDEFFARLEREFDRPYDHEMDGL